MFDGPLELLVRRLAALPGLGGRSARRIALHLLGAKDARLQPLIDALEEAAQSITACTVCGNLDSSDPCRICCDPARDKGVLCVLASVADLWAVERTQSFKGQYHVLGGVLSALDDVGPDNLAIEPLLARLRGGAVSGSRMSESGGSGTSAGTGRAGEDREDAGSASKDGAGDKTAAADGFAQPPFADPFAGGFSGAHTGTPSDPSPNPFYNDGYNDGPNTAPNPHPIREVVLALPATVDGQSTAHYLIDRMEGLDIHITRLAHGVPVGGALEFLDDSTIATALRSRARF
ncbi:MAG: toprim domain-containing protein [Micavibrio sp.]